MDRNTFGNWYYTLLLLMLLTACQQGGKRTSEQPTEQSADIEFYYGGDPFHPNDTGMRRYTTEYDLRQQIEHDGAEVKMTEENTNERIK